MLHSLIVGFGLAGMAYAEHLQRNGDSYRVIYQAGGGSSLQAAGIFNPTILKRYTMAWKGLSFYEEAVHFYDEQAKRLGNSYLQPYPILKVFAQTADHNLWLSAAGTSGLEKFLDPKIYTDPILPVHTPAGYGKVLHMGRLDISGLQKHLIQEHAEAFYTENFDFDALQILDSGVEYKGIRARNLVFCQGFQMHQNPLFDLEPLRGCKGEFLIVEAPEWPENYILKSNLFVVPLGNHRFWVGATFDWKDKTLKPSPEGRKWLEDRLQRLIKAPYTVVDHQAQIRPTVKDRRPLLVQHPQYSHIYALNGLGTRGVLMAPYLSRILLESINQNTPLDPAFTLQRFNENESC